MKSDGKIAQIILEPKTRSVRHITFYIKNLRFKCKRCATFCCKLGGPTLTLKDVERLKKAGCCEADFLDIVHSSLKNTASGSCVLLKFDAEKSVYKCEVYHQRPALCRLYPFHLEKTGPNSLVLKIMPCRGTSRRYGELVEEKFFKNKLFDALHDLYSQSFIKTV